MSRFVSIDIGNSGTKVIKSNGNDVDAIPINGKKMTYPVRMVVNKKGTYIFGDEAFEKTNTALFTICMDIKKNAFETTTVSCVNQERVAMKDMFVEVVKDVRSKLNANNIETNNVILPIPAYYTPEQHEKMQRVCDTVGFEKVVMKNEPECALMDFEEVKTIDGNALVIDFGNRLDISVVKVGKKGNDVEMKTIETVQLDECGGGMIDQMIYNSIIKVFEKDHQNGQKYKEYYTEKGKMVLLNEVTIAKEILSTQSMHTIMLKIPRAQEQTEYIIKREDVDNQCQSVFARIVTEVTKLIGKYQKKGNEMIKSIFVVGGCAQMPSFQKLVTSSFQLPVHINHNPIMAVARGAVKMGQTIKELFVEDDATESVPFAISFGTFNAQLGIAVACPIIEKGMKLPLRTQKEMIIQETNQKQLRFAFYRDCTTIIDEEKKIGDTKITWKEQCKKGDRVLVTFEMEKESTINVTAELPNAQILKRFQQEVIFTNIN